MYRKITSINSITSYTDDCQVSIKNGLIFFINENVTFYELIDQREVFRFGEDYYISKDIRANAVIVKDNKEIVTIGKVNSNSFPYVQIYSDENIRKYIIFDYSTQKILFETTAWIGRDIIEDYIFSDYQGLISARKITSEQLLWQYNLTQLNPPVEKQSLNEDQDWKVKKFIGILESKLWIALNNYTLIGLDLQSGKLIHQLSDIPGFEYPYGSIIPEPAAIHVDKKRKILFGLAWEYYWEIDPNTGYVTMYDLYDYFLSLRLRNDLPMHIVFLEEESRLFFASRFDDLRFDSQLACFDLISKKIIWRYKFEPDDEGRIPQPNNLKGNREKIGVLDKKNTLYIFEKSNHSA